MRSRLAEPIEIINEMNGSERALFLRELLKVIDAKGLHQLPVDACLDKNEEDLPPKVLNTGHALLVEPHGMPSRLAVAAFAAVSLDDETSDAKHKLCPRLKKSLVWLLEGVSCLAERKESSAKHTPDSKPVLLVYKHPRLDNPNNRLYLSKSRRSGSNLDFAA